MKKILITLIALLSLNTFADCKTIQLKNLVACKEVKVFSIVLHEDNENGLSLRLYKGDKEIHKSHGYGVVHNDFLVDGKKERLFVKEYTDKAVLIVRGLNVDGMEIQEDGLFFSKINFQTERIADVFVKLKTGEENTFVTVTSKEKVKIEDSKKGPEVSFGKTKLRYNGEKFEE